MAGRSRYTAADKAAAYVALVACEWNVKRAARETGMPITTIRRWRDEFQQNGPPPMETVQEAVGEFLDEAVKTRDFALSTLKSKIPDAKPGELITIIGVLDDKISRAKGLADRTVEHRHSLPSPDEIREAMAGVVQGAIEASKQRQHEIIDAEIVEQPALPA